ncbi:NADH dehydrogenase FAD-containing subunit [Leptospira wolffii]|uniref:NADH dehydrogenase FAD-containing subunit n=1 Tax=Leptospira wolffii TaxID=409998 RepID=A0A2M9ZAF5_9LEPT|nr:FAD-dependent oxidoreductase [Leptospira wolffii]PJZ65327.1 NADH dehydrogenase FAD-containing subunit [Leptospira wolffii]
MAKKRILILGGGYAGIIAANRLSRKSSDIDITLVTANPRFAEKIRNHQVIAGTKGKSHEISKLLRKNVHLRISKVEKILADRNSILLENGEELSYDYLGYTPGMKGRKNEVSGESYFSIVKEEDSIALRKKLLEKESATITVLGAGLSGIETATELAEAYPEFEITLLDSGNIGKSFHPDAVSHMKKVLTDLRVRILEGKKAERFEKGEIRLENGETVFHDFCILSAGLAASDLGKKSGLSHNTIDQVLVNEYLEVPGYDKILGAGDAVKMPEDEYSYLRMSCATALPMGVYMAERMAARMGYKTKLGNRPFSFGYLLRCVSLGRSEGLIQTVDSEDSPKNKIWTGKFAAIIKELICKFTILSCKAEKYFDFYNWPKPKDRESEVNRPSLAVAGK